jgi:hypothetical protein
MKNPSHIIKSDSPFDKISLYYFCRFVNNYFAESTFFIKNFAAKQGHLHKNKAKGNNYFCTLSKAEPAAGTVRKKRQIV